MQVEKLPFSIEDAQRIDIPLAEGESETAQFSRVLLDTRLNNRIMDLRV